MGETRESGYGRKEKGTGQSRMEDRCDGWKGKTKEELEWKRRERKKMTGRETDKQTNMGRLKRKTKTNGLTERDKKREMQRMTETDR